MAVCLHLTVKHIIIVMEINYRKRKDAYNMKRKLVLTLLMVSMIAAGCGRKTPDVETGHGVSYEEENDYESDTEKPNTEWDSDIMSAESNELTGTENTAEDTPASLPDFISDVTVCGATFTLPDGFYLVSDHTYDKYLENEAGDVLHIAVDNYVTDGDVTESVWTGFNSPVRSMGSGPLTYESEIYKADGNGQKYRMYVRCESNAMNEEEIVAVVETIINDVDPESVDMSAVMELPLTEYGTLELYNE